MWRKLLPRTIFPSFSSDKGAQSESLTVSAIKLRVAYWAALGWGRGEERWPHRPSRRGRSGMVRQAKLGKRATTCGSRVGLKGVQKPFAIGPRSHRQGLLGGGRTRIKAFCYTCHRQGQVAPSFFWNRSTSSIPKESCLPVSVDHSNPSRKPCQREKNKRREALKAHCRAPSNTIRPKRYKEKERPHANGIALLDWISSHQDRFAPSAMNRQEGAI